MKSSKCYLVQVLATGFVVLTLLSIPLFWFQTLCRMSLSERIPGDLKNALIEPSGFLAKEVEDDPNLARKSRITAVMYPERLFLQLGITDYLESVAPGGRRSNVYVADSQTNWAYFDKASGQIICRYDEAEIMPDKNKLHREVQYYVGPEGISEIPNESLGRFSHPIIDYNWLNWSWDQAHLRDLILYDTKLKRFFRIDFNKTTIIKGPELTNNDGVKPVQIGLLSKNPLLLFTSWSPPTITILPPSRTEYRRENEPIIETAHYSDDCPYLLVLSKNGTITLLDKETLEFVGPAGRLPETETFLGSERLVTPLNTLAYDAKPVFLGALKSPEEMKNLANQEPKNAPLRYAGMIVASVSRDGTNLAVSVFDENGQKKPQTHESTRKQSDDVEMAYFGSPWSPACTIGMYLAENLHPPILSLASYFTASTFEAGFGYKALFLLPNSFIAMQGRDSRENFALRLISALILVIPSILLAFWLTSKVRTDAANVGLSPKARFCWIIGTILFGLPAYITYKLTKPGMTLVTCANCGKPRRPDMDTCHQCGSPWHVPELIPPNWRVLDT